MSKVNAAAPTLPIKERALLRKQMPKGFRALAMTRMEVRDKPLRHPELVSMYFNGRYNNPELQQVLMEIADEAAEQLRAMKRTIKRNASA